MSSHHGLMAASATDGYPAVKRKPDSEKQVRASTGSPPDPPEDKPVIDADTPIPVKLTQRTLFNLVMAIVVPLMGIVAAGAYYFHKSQAHMSDPTTHLTRGERSGLQTKVGCKANSDRLAVDIKREVQLNHRQAIVEQKEQIQKVGQQLEAQQKSGLKKILLEVRQGHRATRRAFRHSTP